MMTCRRTLPLLFLAIVFNAGNAISLSRPFSHTRSPLLVPSSGGIKGGYWQPSMAEKFPPLIIPTQYFTHLFYAFVVPDQTSYQLLITEADHVWMPNFTATAHGKDPLAKAMLSIGGAGASTVTFSAIAATSDARAAFIKSSIWVARKYGFDGLDLDWEFPANPEEMSGLAALLCEWRGAAELEATAAGKPRLLLSAAVYFASTFFLEKTPFSYPADSIKNCLDFVNPMCYDYHGAWDNSSTGAQALLYDKQSNVSTSYGISTWVGSGVPPEKVVMGLPMYGRTWKLIDPSQHGIGAPANGTGPGEGLMLYNQILDFNSEKNASVVFDDGTVSTYSYSGTDWIGYDDHRSIQKKVEYARANGLGGYFFWAVEFDDQNWTLSQTASVAWDCHI